MWQPIHQEGTRKMQSQPNLMWQPNTYQEGVRKFIKNVTQDKQPHMRSEPRGSATHSTTSNPLVSQIPQFHNPSIYPGFRIQQNSDFFTTPKVVPLSLSLLTNSVSQNVQWEKYMICFHPNFIFVRS